MFESLFKRAYGSYNLNKLNKWYQIDLSNILENFEGRAREEYILASEEDGGTVPPLACSFCKVKSSAGHVLALVDENGYMVLHNTTKSGPEAILKEWQAHNNAVFDLEWMETEEKLLSGSGDQTAVLWDAKTSQKLETFKGHTSSIRSVAFRRHNDSVLATGSRDGHIMLWDKRCNHKDGSIPPINTIRNAHVISTTKRKKNRLGPALDSQQSVTAVTFQNENLLISAGAVDGYIKVWDLRKNYSNTLTEPQARYMFPYCGNSQRKHGYSCLTVDTYGSTLYASCTDDVIYVFDLISYDRQPVKTIRGHKNTTFYIKTSLSPDNKFLLSGSSDDMAYIWQVDKPSNSPVILKGHNAEVTSVAWCQHDMTKLATISDDNTMRMWRINRGGDKAPLQGEVTGTAELTHREIGTSTIKATLSSPACSPAPKIPPLRQIVSAPTPTKSPSLKQWFFGSASKTPKSLTTPKSLSTQKSITTPKSLTTPKFVTTPKSLTQSFKQSGIKTDSQLKRTTLDFSSNVAKCPEERELDSCDIDTDKVVIPFQNQDGCSKTLNTMQSVKTQNQDKVSEICLQNCDLSQAVLPPLLTTPVKPSNKRKLDSSDHEQLDTPSKRSNVLEAVDANQNICEERLTPACVESCKKNEMTPKYSPTHNLPNIVTDELEGRSPRMAYRGNKENCQSRKKLDWLTQIRLNREGFEGTCLLSPGKSTQSSSDEHSSQNSDGASPGRPKTPLRGKNSIAHYFAQNKTPKK